MSLIEDKPHVWVGKRPTNTFFLSIIADCKEGMGISLGSEYCTEHEEDNRLIISFKIHEMGGYNNHLEYDLNAANNSNFDELVHDKVTVMFTDESDNPLAFHTVKPVKGEFSGNANDPKPHLFLKSKSSDNATIHIEVSLPEECVFLNLTTVDVDAEYKRRVTYYYGTDGYANWRPVHLDYSLNETTGYDPVFDDIVVEFIVKDSSGSGDRKGKGTTHNAEGDASGEG